MSPGKIPTFHPQCPHDESNVDDSFRKRVLSPLSYGGMLKLGANDPDRTGNLPGTNRTLSLLSFVGMEPPEGIEPSTSPVPGVRSSI